MIKRNGFTLVEMLAVIVLIAVLSVVAVSTYRGINESSKKKALEAKIMQIETAAEKWARENNISNGMNISVNNLVVEGYITADEVGTDGLAVIKNPVTDENMVCNTVELKLKNGEFNSHFNANVYNCKLASQSLVDNNIKIKVYSASGQNLTTNESGSIAKWTNEDVAIIVNSDTYDAKATSISYDFEGSTYTKNKDSLTKYTGDGFVSERDADKYYNVYYIKSELLMNTNIIVTYDIPGEGTKSRFYTIRFDKEEAAAVLSSVFEWLTTKSDVVITVDDGKGSGPAGIYMSQNATAYEESSFKETSPSITLEGLDVGRYYIWTVDKAGNVSHTYKMILDINNQDDTKPECKVNFHGTLGNHGWYKEDPVTPGGETTKPAGISGNNVGVNMDQNNPVYSAFAKYETTIEGLGEVREDNTPKDGTPYYCHVKTLSGNYNNASDTLYLDRTPPTLNIVVDNPNTHEQHKSVHVTIRDTLSGLNPSTTVRYGLSMSNTNPPANNAWTDINITTSAQNNAAVTKDFTTTELVTGTWYLWIDASGYTDWAGNKPVGNQNGTTYVFGPYKFDNTAPVCDGNNGKTKWTMGGYNIFQKCRDNQGTADQSGCTLPIYPVVYTNIQTVKDDSVTIYDNAGNSTVCGYNVYIDNTKPVCGTDNGKTNWTKGTYTVTVNCSDGTNQSECTQNSYSSFYDGTVKESSITIIDVAGNTRVCPINVYLDNTPPVCGSTSGDSTTWTNQPRTVNVQCSDADSGCGQNVYSKTNNSSIITDSITISDIAGNSVVCGPYNYYIDTDKPRCHIISVTRQCTESGVVATAECSEGNGDIRSGLATCNGFETNQVALQVQRTRLTNDYTFSVTDKAGNVSHCTVFVKNVTHYNRRTCNTGNRCSAAGCETPATCTSSCCGIGTYYDGTCSDEPIEGAYCYWQDDYGALCGQMYNCSWEVPYNKTCTDESCCGCATYNASIALCGCYSWNLWEGWQTTATSCSEAGANSCETDSRTLYFSGAGCDTNGNYTGQAGFFESDR